MSIAYRTDDGTKEWGAGLPTRLEVRFSPAAGDGAALGESPFWDHGDCIWWVDITGRRLLRTSLSTRATRSWPTPQTPGFVVLAAPDRPMVGMERGIYAFDPADASFSPLVPFDAEGERFNDATVDETGRLWVSTMALDTTPGRGAVHLVTGDLGLKTVLGGLTTPNGLAADAARARLYVSDSHTDIRTIWTVDCDFATGETGTRATFASLRHLDGRPDGAALAGSGRHYWIAGVDGGALYGYTPEGRMEYTLPLPFPAPTKPVLLDGFLAVTAKGEGGYGGQIAIAVDPPPPLRGAPVPFWRPGGRRLPPIQ